MVTVLNQEQWNEKSFLIEPRELDTIHENQNLSLSSDSSILQSPTSEDSVESSSFFGIESDEGKSADNPEVFEPGELSFEMMESIYMTPVKRKYRSSLRFHRTPSCRLIEITKNPARIPSNGEYISKTQQPISDMGRSLTLSDVEFVQNEMWSQQKSNDFSGDSDLSLQLVLFI